MWRNRVLAEGAVSSEVVLLPTDTLLHALRVMERRRVRLLPVVRGEEGEVVGLVSRGHLLAVWQVDPLLPVGLVMMACQAPREGGCGRGGRHSRR
jgi:CBS domain-containing protein